MSPSNAPATDVPTASGLAAGLIEIIDAGAVVVDAEDAVVLENATARALGVVRVEGELDDGIRALAGQARRVAARREVDLNLTADASGPGAVVQAVAVPLDGAHVGVVAQDVSEARRVEAVRRDFVANVTHELKTPVGSLVVLGEALNQASEEPAVVRRFAARVEHEARRLGRLVGDLIELSRLQGGDPPPVLAAVPVDRIRAEAVDRVRAAAESRDIKIVTAGDRGLAVRGHEGQLVTALANLLDNAVAYSDTGTVVRFSSREEPGGMVAVAVTDEGIGISRRDRNRIFERFYRADPARARATGGTGLGLALVKHAVANHGGWVAVDSAPGIGSTFTLHLPIARAHDPRHVEEVES